MTARDFSPSELYPKRRRWSVLAALLVFLIFSFLVWLFFRSSILNVKNVSIEGNRRTSDREIIDSFRKSGLDSFLGRLLGPNSIFLWKTDRREMPDLPLI